MLQQKLAKVIQELAGGDAGGYDGPRSPDMGMGMDMGGAVQQPWGAQDQGFATPYGNSGGGGGAWGAGGGAQGNGSSTPYGATPYGQNGGGGW